MKKLITTTIATLALLVSCLIFSTQSVMASVHVANHVYTATFVDANGYSTKYQMVCFTKSGRAAYVNVDGFNEKQQPLFNDQHSHNKQLLHKYLTHPRQLRRAAQSNFTINGRQMTINNGLVNDKTKATLEKDATSKSFTVRYPDQAKQKYQTIVFKLAPKNYQYK